MDRNHVRKVVGLLVAVVIFLALDAVFSGQGSTMSAALVRMSLFAAVAFALGGYIAVSNFVIPAIILAALMWFVATVWSMYIGMDFGDFSLERLAWNLPSAVLVLAAGIGAKIGSALASKRAGSTTH